MRVRVGITRREFLLLWCGMLIERVRVAVLGVERSRTHFRRCCWRFAVAGLTVAGLTVAGLTVAGLTVAALTVARRFRLCWSVTLIRVRARRLRLRPCRDWRGIGRNGHIGTDAGLGANPIQHRDVLVRVLEALEPLHFASLGGHNNIRRNSLDIVELRELTLLRRIDFNRNVTRR